MAADLLSQLRESRAILARELTRVDAAIKAVLALDNPTDEAPAPIERVAHRKPPVRNAKNGAIERVRSFVSTHPNATAHEVSEVLGFEAGQHLAYLHSRGVLSRGLVESTNSKSKLKQVYGYQLAPFSTRHT